MGPLISIKDAALGYGRTSILRGVSLDVHRGDYVGIVGPNGSGKTTLLKAILGLIRPIAGSVHRLALGHTIGYVPQRDTLDTIYPLSVLDIVLMGLYDQLPPVGQVGRRHREAGMDALSHAGIADLADRHYASLSGGQKQRAIIARALVSGPELLLLDEPTNGMDLASEASVLGLIRHLHDEDGITVLLVTHLLHTVINHAAQIAFVGDGSVEVMAVHDAVETHRLSELYGIPLSVGRCQGRHVVLPSEPDSRGLGPLHVR
jgi:ABC-type Mn2+/Zn2+ transport system ATPase subunit